MLCNVHCSLATSPCNLRIEKLSNCQGLCSRCGGTHSVAPDEKQPTLSTVTVNSRNDMIFIPQRSARTNECKIALISSDCFMNGFIMPNIIFMTATSSENSVQSFGVQVVSQSHSLVVTSAVNPASENSPQLIGELGSVMDTLPISVQNYASLAVA